MLERAERQRRDPGDELPVVALDERDAWRLWRLVVLGSAAFTVLGLVVAVLQQALPDGLPGAGALDLGSDSSIPTWWAAVTLLACAGLAGVVRGIERAAGSRYSRHWAGLALGFLFMSVDEVARVHERVGDAAAGVLPAFDGAFFYTWVVIALPLVGLVALTYARFVVALPPRTRGWLVAGGVLFLAGALGMEMVNAAQESAAGTADTLGYGVGTVVEEALEMAGVAVLMAALLRHLGPRLTMTVTAPAPAP